ncbi:MAG: c-type cytochrome [Bacteroidota bacterium]
MNMKLFSVLLVTLLLSACGGSKKDSATQEEFVANEEVSSVTSQIAEGEALVKGSDCKTCHHAVNKIIGPAHTDVAKKYEFTAANVSMLAQKIIKGGQGVWGQIPMTAHPDITVADAEKMARYVLSLDGEQEH